MEPTELSEESKTVMKPTLKKKAFPSHNRCYNCDGEGHRFFECPKSNKRKMAKYGSEKKPLEQVKNSHFGKNKEDFKRQVRTVAWRDDIENFSDVDNQ